jgi:predicted RNA-binding Zn ribbon-like protein
MHDLAPVEPAPGADAYPALDLANSALALPGGQFIDLLGTPEAANAWLTKHGLAPVDAGIREMCAAQLRTLREQIRALLACRVDRLPVPASALAALNDALLKTPAVALLEWDQEHGPYRAVPHPTTQILEHALATLADNAAELLAGPDAERLTACGSPHALTACFGPDDCYGVGWTLIHVIETAPGPLPAAPRPSTLTWDIPWGRWHDDEAP